MRLDLDSTIGSTAYLGDERICVPDAAPAIAEADADKVRYPAKMNLVRLLLDFTRLSQRSEEVNPAELFFAIDHIAFDPLTHDRVADIATAMIADALCRLRSVTAPQMVVTLENIPGEVRFSIIDNSSQLPAPQKCLEFQRAMIPLGGFHTIGCNAGRVNSAFCFLPRRGCSLGGAISTSSPRHTT